MFDEHPGLYIKIRKLERIIYKLKQNIDLDDKEKEMVNKILEKRL